MKPMDHQKVGSSMVIPVEAPRPSEWETSIGPSSTPARRGTNGTRYIRVTQDGVTTWGRMHSKLNHLSGLRASVVNPS